MSGSKYQPESSMGGSTWLNRGAGVGLILGLLLGIGGTAAWFTLREPPTEEAKVDPPPKPETPAPEPAKVEPPVAVDPDAAKKTQAHRGCQSLATAIDAYMLSASNPGINDEERLPVDLNNLAQPPWGGGSFLRNGQKDLIDPWSKPYQLMPAKKPDGTTYLLVLTTAPDGTPISQFGIGADKAFPTR